MPSAKIIFIVGPTAVGKTAVACALARVWGGEIVSCDAMQVYREVGIASNKPFPESQDGIPHHLIDVVSVSEEFDVAAYNRLAREAIGDIQRRGKVPIVCGGSGMYMQVLLDGIFMGGEKNPVLRAELENELGQSGAGSLHARLKTVDPEAAARIHPHDVRRVIRALEVYHSTALPISQLRQVRSGLWGTCPVFLYGLNGDRPWLYQRINQRVEEMVQQGLVEEIRALAGKDLSLTAKRIIGVSEIQAFLRGELSLEQAKELMKMNTRRYAKRQLTWFRKEQRLTWLTPEPDAAPDAVARAILEDIKKKDSHES